MNFELHRQFSFQLSLCSICANHPHTSAPTLQEVQELAPAAQSHPMGMPSLSSSFCVTPFRALFIVGLMLYKLVKPGLASVRFPPRSRSPAEKRFFCQTFFVPIVS